MSFEGPIPKVPKHKPIREKYNRYPNARERAYHDWLMENFPCACGCGKPSGVVHHVLEDHPEKRWRRDHKMVVPMDGMCHMKLHRHGSETGPWEGMARKAADFRTIAIGMGKL